MVVKARPGFTEDGFSWAKILLLQWRIYVRVYGFELAWDSLVFAQADWQVGIYAASLGNRGPT